MRVLTITIDYLFQRFSFSSHQGKMGVPGFPGINGIHVSKLRYENDIMYLGNEIEGEMLIRSGILITNTSV